jgi:hypothetical protein
VVAGEVAAEHGDLEQIGGEGSAQDTRSGLRRVDAIKRRDFDWGEDCLRRRLWLCCCGHGEEEDEPADHRDKGEELRKPRGGLEPRLFGAAAGLHHLVEHLRLPAQGVPFELLDCGGEIADRQIGHQLPVDRWTVCRWVDLKGLDVGEKLRTISLPLADRRQGLDGGELYVHPRRFVLADLDAIASRPGRSRELGEDPMRPILQLGAREKLTTC